MFKRSWREYVALGLALALACAWAVVALKPFHETAKPESTACESNDARCEAEQDARDLNAQESMALAAWAQVTLNALGVVIAGFGVIYVARTLNAQKIATGAAVKQAEIALKEFRYSRRPVLTIDVTRDNIEALEEYFEAPEEYQATYESIPRIEFELKNVGDGPALVREFRAQIGIAKEPPVPERETLIFFDWIDVHLIKAGDSLDLETRRFHEIDAQELIGLKKGPFRLFFSGLIYYTDYAGNGWELGFVFVRAHTIQGMAFERIREAPHYFDREVEGERSGREPKPGQGPDWIF